MNETTIISRARNGCEFLQNFINYSEALEDAKVDKEHRHFYEFGGYEYDITDEIENLKITDLIFNELRKLKETYPLLGIRYLKKDENKAHSLSNFIIMYGVRSLGRIIAKINPLSNEVSADSTVEITLHKNKLNDRETLGSLLSDNKRKKILNSLKEKLSTEMPSNLKILVDDPYTKIFGFTNNTGVKEVEAFIVILTKLFVETVIYESNSDEQCYLNKWLAQGV